MDLSEMSEDRASEWSYDYDLDEEFDETELDGSTYDDGTYADCEVVAARRRAPWDIITPANIQQHQVNH